jgi:NAD(P)-dependent dehydrogenase (short-subunit alcohol dehydrogenase family)/acyl carrier protein
VLIPGGLGAIGFKLAERLAEVSAAKVVLVSRRAPAEAASSAVRSIEALGGEALVAAADLSDREAMAAVIDLAEKRFGPITAVIHAAGAAGPAALAFAREDAEVHAVLDAKTKGIEVLVDLLGDHPLTLFAAMGSVNGVIGAPTLSDYCAANAVLDAFVESDLKPKAWSRVMSIGWGPWRDIGMAARLLDGMEHQEEQAVRRRNQIPPDEAVLMFERLAATNRPHAVVLMNDLNALLASKPLQERKGAAQVSDTAATRSSQARPLEPMTNETELKLAEFWRTLLGVPEVGATDDFFELGGHSLLATRLMARIFEQFGVKLTLRDVFDAPTIRKQGIRIAAVEASNDREELVL